MDTINDKTDYREVSSSLNTLQFTKDDQETLWRVVGAILHLGNIEFDEIEEKLIVKKSKCVDMAAELLQVSAILSLAVLFLSINFEPAKCEENFLRTPKLLISC